MDSTKVIGVLITVVGVLIGYVGRNFNNRIIALEKRIEEGIHEMKEEIDDINVDMRKDVIALHKKIDSLVRDFSVLQGEHKVNHK
ncbi:MAG: hypothetical protein JSW06_02810 [Thermoplasmatales archaeon]|nr:MAG: hypothetical protein JSW06_02810 [Thermoplasmatales archaeon]